VNIKKYIKVTIFMVIQEMPSFVQYLFSLSFTDEEGKPGRESVHNISTVMCKADELIKDGELHDVCIGCDK